MGDTRDAGRDEGGAESGGAVTLFLCGDVMTGRGIDQVLPHPSDPALHERYLRSASDYVRRAERANGPIARPVSYAYVWGDALEEWRRVAPDVRIVNLETSVTTHDAWVDKGINYRMHPENVPCLSAAGIDCCTLANNHVLDWGRAGLLETIESLRAAGLATAGAGRDARTARAPAVLELPGRGRVIVFAFGTTTSGIPAEWAATDHAPGVNLLPELSDRTLRSIASDVRKARRPGDIVVASIHWGGNWGYGIPPAQRTFAHGLIDAAGVDVVHGHSSHHPKGIEVYGGKPILYGCGDFITDYEGIGGYEDYRGNLSLMYFARIDSRSGKLQRLSMTPLELHRFRLRRASPQDSRWLRERLTREGRPLGTSVEAAEDGTLALSW